MKASSGRGAPLRLCIGLVRGFCRVYTLQCITRLCVRLSQARQPVVVFQSCLSTAAMVTRHSVSLSTNRTPSTINALPYEIACSNPTRYQVFLFLYSTKQLKIHLSQLSMIAASCRVMEMSGSNNSSNRNQHSRFIRKSHSAEDT